MVWMNGLVESRADFASKLRDRFTNAAKSWDRLKVRRGRRYEACKFGNYKANTPAQRQVVEYLECYAKNGEEEFMNGKNVILFGPKGTGKDHLLMALAFEFINWCGRSVSWVNGVDLMEDFQLVAMDKNRKHFSNDPDETPEKCDVLWISDPLPPSGALSEFQQRALFQLMDRRYSDMRPTWVSINVANGAEAEARMGAQVVDRLRHGSLDCFCNWPSYRTQPI